MDNLTKRIMDADLWPYIDSADNLETLNAIADSVFSSGSLEGLVAATLIYHQIIELMCKHILEDCCFFIELSIYPARINFRIPSDKMFGYYLNELEKSMDFSGKEQFISSVRQFNKIRIDIVHRLCKNNISATMSKISNIKVKFDEIYKQYDAIQDSFRVDFHGFKKDVFIDYLSNEEYVKYFE